MKRGELGACHLRIQLEDRPGVVREQQNFLTGPEEGHCTDTRYTADSAFPARVMFVRMCVCVCPCVCVCCNILCVCWHCWDTRQGFKRNKTPVPPSLLKHGVVEEEKRPKCAKKPSSDD